METIYRPKKLHRSGALFSVFLLVLMMMSYIASSQTTYTLSLGITGCGQKVILNEGTTLENVFVGDRATTLITQTFNDQQRITIRVEPVQTAGPYSWYQWSGADAGLLVPTGSTGMTFTLDFTHNMVITANFRRDLYPGDLTFTAQNKQYDGNRDAFGTTGAIKPGALVQGSASCTARTDVAIVYNNVIGGGGGTSPSYQWQSSLDNGGFSNRNGATVSEYPKFDTKEVGNGKTVTFAGLTLTGTDAQYYRLVDASGNPTTTGTCQANITKRQILVSNATVQSKVYDANANATIVAGAGGFIPAADPPNSPAVVTGETVVINYTANSGQYVTSCGGSTLNINVGTDINVNTTFTLSGAHAGNYMLVGYWVGGAKVPCLKGNITQKPLYLPNLVGHKRFDELATIPIALLNDQNTGGQLNGTSSTVAGIISTDQVTLVFGAATAAFNNASVGTAKPLTITGLSLTSPAGAHASDYLNYSIANPYTGYQPVSGPFVPSVGDIWQRIYAMFTPTYNVGRSGQPPIVDVPLNQVFKIKFSEEVVNVYNNPITQSSIGDHIAFERVVSGSWTPVSHIPFTPVYANNEVTINTTGSPLKIDSSYRVRFFGLYNKLIDGGGLVAWSLDGTPPNPATPSAFVKDDKIIFNTRTQIPLLYPKGETVPVCDIIKVDFVNAVKYRNGTTIGADPTHKFMLQKAVPGSGVWVTQAITASVDVVGAPKIITITPAQPLTYYSQYRVLMLKGEDSEFGFTDMVTGVNLLATGPVVVNNPDGIEVGWTWTTTGSVPVSITSNGAIDYPVTAGPTHNVITLNGTDVIAVQTSPVTVNTNLLWGSNTLIAVPSEGYKWVTSVTPANYPWRKTDLGVTTGITNATSFSVTGAEVAKTCNVTPVNFAAYFTLKSYYVVNGTPANGTIAGGSASARNHGTFVEMTATPAPGYYFTGWTGIPAGVNIVTQTVAQAGDPWNMNLAKTGSLKFQLTGNQIVDGNTYTVSATFAAFTPKVWLTHYPQGRGNVSIQAISSSQDILEASVENYTYNNISLPFGTYRMKYNAPIKLIAYANCGYEFVQWFRQNLPDTTWSPYSTNDTIYLINMDQNYRLRADMKVKTYHVTATTSPTTNGTIAIDATNVNNQVIHLITNPNVTPPVLVIGDDFTHFTTIHLTVYPIPGYEVKSWNNPYVMPLPANPLYPDRSEWTYIPMDNNCAAQSLDLVANIGLREYVITAQPNSGFSLSKLGSVTGTPVAATTTLNKFVNDASAGTTTGTFQHFTTGLALTATPVANFRFDHWEDLTNPGIYGTSTANPYVLVEVTRARSIKAFFVPDQPTYPCVVAVAPADGGVTDPPVGTYPFWQHNAISGITSTHTFTATAMVGYQFVNWTATGITLTVPQQNNPVVTFNMPGNAVTLTANFQLIEHPFTAIVRTYLRGPSQETCPVTTTDGGTIFDNTGTGPYHTGEVISLTAAASPGFEFVNFMVGTLSGQNTLESSNNCILTGRQINLNGLPTFNYTVPAQNENIVVYGIFREQTFPAFPKFVLTTSSSPVAAANTYGAGTYVQTVVVNVDQTDANLNDGRVFDYWTVNNNPAGNTSAIQVNINGDKDAVAHYKLDTYHLTAYAAFDHGTVTLNGHNSSNPVIEYFNVEDAPIYCTATAAAHYEFVKWTYDLAGTLPVLDVLGSPVTQNFSWVPVAHNETIYAQFRDALYNVTLDVRLGACYGEQRGGTAAVIVPGPGPYINGTEITLLATPAAGYNFKHWRDEACNIIITIPQFNYTISGNVKFTAVFDTIRYDVTASVQAFVPPAGTVSPVLQTTTVTKPVSVTATVNCGYTFLNWSGANIPAGTDLNANPISFLMPASNVTLQANYTPINYAVTATAQTGGSVAPANQSKKVGESVTVTATVLPGYTFSGWEATGITAPTGNPAVFTMPCNAVTLMAKFTAIPYTLGVSANPANGGTFTATTPTYTVGQAVSVTTTANPGFLFVNWSGTGIPAGTVLTDPTISFSMPAGNVALFANFNLSANTIAGQVKYFNQYETVMPQTAKIKVALDNNGVLTQEQFLSYAPGEAQGSYLFTNIVPGTNYTVRLWEAPTGGTVANTWSWNNWGGVNSLDALIISYMYLQNPSLATQFPWLVKPGMAVPNWSDLFGGFSGHNYNVANVNKDAVIDNLDALTAMYRSIGMPGTSPFPGGSFNFQVAGQTVASGAMTYPAAPTTVFTQTGTYVPESAASSVHYKGVIAGAAGSQTFNIFYIATGDVNASYVPGAGIKSASNGLAYAGELKVNVGDVVKIPVVVTQDMSIGAMTVGLKYNTQLLQVTGVEGFQVFNIDESNGTVYASMFDVQGRNYDMNSNVIIVTAKVLAPIQTSDRYFELEANTMYANPSANLIDGIVLSTPSLTTDALTSAGNLTGSALTHKCFPNPFNTVSNIQYTLPATATVEVNVYNSLGGLVKTFVNETQVAGVHTVQLNATDLNGAGVYFYRISVKGDSKTQTGTGSLILIK